MGVHSGGSSWVEPLEARCLRSGGPVMAYGDNGITFPSTGGEASNDQVICAAMNNGAFVLRGDILTRLLPNGSVDSSFGGSGVNVAANLSQGTATDIAATPDGGAIVEVANVDTNGDDGLIKFNADGSRDAAFGTDGLVDTAAYNSALTQAVQTGPVVVQRDGDILWIFSTTASSGFGLGEQVNTYSLFEALTPEGETVSPVADTLLYSDAAAVLVDPAGELFFPGTTPFFTNSETAGTPGVAVECDNADGSGNMAYGSGSYLQLNQLVVSGNLLGAVVDSKGRVTVDGIINGKALMLRFTASGKLDRTFGKDGKVVLSGLSFTGSESNNLIRESDGSFLIGGQATPKGGHGVRAAVQHYTADGVFDPNYGSFGLGILTSKEGLVVGDAATLAAGPNGSFLVSTTLRDTVDGASRQRLVIDDVLVS